MTSLKLSNYYDAKKTYIGIAETVNPNAGYHEEQIVKKVVLLTKDEKDKYKPLYDDYEYHKLITVQPVASYLIHNEKGIFGYINEEQLKKAVSRTGLQEAKRLTRDNNKILKKSA